MKFAAKSLIGFDFYGAGNIGDDLMLAGFLDRFAPAGEQKLCCFLAPERLSSQRKRFDLVEWHSPSANERASVMPQFRHWIGVGGTPFQATSGPWLLNQALADVDSAPSQKRWMMGVGCESEVLRQKELAGRLARSINHIWTRDAESCRILVEELGADARKVSIGGDLAHIALRMAFPLEVVSRPAEGTVGIVYYEDVQNPWNTMSLRKFHDRHKATRKITFIANDVRSYGFERTLYRKMFGRLRGVFSAQPEFFEPDYASPVISGLVDHFRRYDTVMASRYHALLSAAWAGCRVVAFDRSSKIRCLAGELGIPLIKSPFKAQVLDQGLEEAKVVPRSLLEKKSVAAAQSVSEFCRMLDLRP